jgi:hypothetical protein
MNKLLQGHIYLYEYVDNNTNIRLLYRVVSLIESDIESTGRYKIYSIKSKNMSNTGIYLHNDFIEDRSKDLGEDLEIATLLYW